NKRNYAYVNKILKNWESRGFKTIADVDAAEKQRQIELEQKYNKPAFNKYNKQTKQEILPDWFDKEQQEAPKKQKMTEEEKKAYEEVMRKLGRGDELEAKA
ncbi:DnaD domain protein, partial [Listeria monocytogenes]|nr:DnaD domain protein [Listeria monocytogenes]EAD2635196.1 DnaD domain protein [Listeria monocytogenes]EAF2666629.1 DnaD domain protein [Listeria monocytogenes]